MDNKLIGRRINSALARAGMLQKELAKAIGVTDNTISYFCSGTRTPNVSQIIDIARILEVSTDYLLGTSDIATLDASVQAVVAYTGLSEDNAKFLSDGMARLRDNCPPADFEDMFILDPGSQAYYRARGVLFILNSWIELMRNDPGMCRRADKLYQFFITSHTSDPSDSADSRNEWLHLTAHMLSEEEYMRYISNETAKAFDAYLVSKCLSGIPAEQE